ncbi:MAG TPA: beta-L-arabinofuranosidase domain-containing protein, partial [Candidatus Acidoferrum sp.]|nr:beta-L-arabinofuranosidase domain-containing protein [Candidatus Acidoferrum sp.]
MSKTHRWSRRQWISAAAAATGAAAVFPRRGLASLGRVFGSAASGSVKETVDTKLKAFPLSQVRLRPGIFLDQLESNQSFVESLPNDRLLHTFRLTAGIPSSADPLGGWEHPRGELRGHFAGGHVLSACALLHAATGDDAIKQKGNVLVAELAKCQ